MALTRAEFRKEIVKFVDDMTPGTFLVLWFVVAIGSILFGLIDLVYRT